MKLKGLLPGFQGYEADGFSQFYDMQSGTIYDPENLTAVFVAAGGQEVRLPVDWNRLRKFDPEAHAKLWELMKTRAPLSLK